MVFKRAITSVMNIGKRILGKGERVPKKARDFVQHHNDEEVHSLVIVRTPVEKYVDKFLNVISLGLWNKVYKEHYDQLFHLKLVINGKYKTEKRPNIYFGPNSNESGKREEYQVSLQGKHFTIGEMFEKAKAIMGDKFDKYDMVNNCQQYVLALLKGVGLAKSPARGFIYQDVGSIVKELPNYVADTASTITSVAQLADYIGQEVGLPALSHGGVLLDKPFMDMSDPNYVGRPPLPEMR